MERTEMKHRLDSPDYNDNRSYDYVGSENVERYEYSHIATFVTPKARVIDLGCGNGILLQKLKTEKDIADYGIERSESAVRICRDKGLKVELGQIDKPLLFRDNEFDYAICNVTIQMVLYPEVLLREMKRIARYQIISFPNFAFWRSRIDLLFNGRMPKRMLFGYKWYSTGHIHQLSFADFYELVNDVGGLHVVEQRLEHSQNPIKEFLMQQFPNLFQMLGMFLLEKK
jgi:methionine biosynthesis protein MetW